MDIYGRAKIWKIYDAGLFDIFNEEKEDFREFLKSSMKH